MSLRYALLGLLAEAESHGYRLVKELAARLGPCWHPNVGQVYQLLHELEGRGWVVQRPEAGGARARRLFRLTTRGERVLRTWLGRRPGWPPPMRDEIFVRVLAAERLGAHAIRAQLDRHEQEYRRHLALLEEQAAGANGSLARELAHDAALAHAQAHLRWLEHCREVLTRPAVRAAS